MVIPRGKKFKLTAIPPLETRQEIKQAIPTATQHMLGYRYVPEDGFLGNAYLGQDINLNLVNHYVKPLEGILDKVPHIADIAMRAGSGGLSIKNHRFTSMKYWTGSEPMDLDFQFVFETQVDSYYDVYRPVTDLMELALPGENDAGFMIPPTPTLKLIAQEGVKLFNEAAKGFKGNDANTVGRGAEFLSKEASALLKNVESRIQTEGYKVALHIGNNFIFFPILIKNVTPTFSTENAYAPIYALNEIANKARGTTKSGSPKPWLDVINPYTLGEKVTKGICQTIGAQMALAQNGASVVASVLKLIPGPVKKIIEKLEFLPSFPIRAEVNISMELQFPMVKSKNNPAKIQPHHIDYVLPRMGTQDIKY